MHSHRLSAIIGASQQSSISHDTFLGEFKQIGARGNAFDGRTGTIQSIRTYTLVKGQNSQHREFKNSAILQNRYSSLTHVKSTITDALHLMNQISSWNCTFSAEVY